MNTPHFYDVDLVWNEGRIGTITSPKLEVPIEVATPPEFKNGVPGIWSPEHLFVAAVSSCLMTTFLAISENSNLAYDSFKCNAVGKLETIDGKMLITEITLKPVVVITNESDRERAERIILKSEQSCLISNSIKSKINLETLVQVRGSEVEKG